MTIKDILEVKIFVKDWKPMNKDYEKCLNLHVGFLVSSCTQLFICNVCRTKLWQIFKQR